MFKVPEIHRLNISPNDGTGTELGNNGAFVFNYGGMVYRIIAADGAGWEHVSLHLAPLKKGKAGRPFRCPTWDEMCRVKDLFWDVQDTVVQFHPPEDQYVNMHPYVLHLWRKVGSEFELPPKILTGI